MIRCEHAMPGRLRLKAWPASPELLQGLRQSFLSIPGVRSVEARLTTGSLVVHHDHAVSQEQILAQAGIANQPLPPAWTDAGHNRLGDAIAEIVVQAAMEHLLGKPAAMLLNALL
jgi:hypothetical protein